MTKEALISDVAIPPGEFLQEVLDEKSMTQKDLSMRMARPAQKINEILKGSKAITPETAIQLEQVLGVRAHIWTGLEAEYRLILAKQEAAKRVEEEAACVKLFPYNDLCKLGFVQKTRKLTEKVVELRKFFSVSSLHNLQDVANYNPAFRLSNHEKVAKEAIVSWLRAGSLVAKRVSVAPFSKPKLGTLIPALCSLTLEKDPHVLMQKLQSALADVGIALVIMPHFPKTYVTGATFWEGNKAIVMMSLRGGWADIFWFSLFHEIGHILLHNKRTVFIEGKVIDIEHQRQEQEADEFARGCLIPEDNYKQFIDAGDFSVDSIKAFGNTLGIHPGIVTGRLQHDNLLTYTEHFCREKYQWAN